ncbi:MAG: FlgO family outer membrane protein [Candidatus Cloacimonadota bacterium]|nr:FlgO family outer membrane protein [Candidatus Cloacimonadota bacterium]
MFKKICILEKLIPVAILLILTSCATTQKQPIVKAETFEKPEITNNLDNSLSDLTTQITNSIAEDGKKKIAVIEFSGLDGNVTQFGKYLAEELITRLFRTKKFEVVERQLLNKIISEQKLSITGMIDPNSAKELGRILGVDAIVSGTITDLGKSLKVNARIISAETGKVFGVAGTKIVKDETVEKLMGIISTVQKEEFQKEEVQKQMEKKEISKEALKKVEVENFTFEVPKCKISPGGKVTCDLLITNNDKKDREFKLSAYNSRIFDNFGNEYQAKEAQLANKEGMQPKSLLVSGVPTSLILSFDNVSKEARSVALLQIYFNLWSSYFGHIDISKSPNACLRNIPLTK